MSSLRLIYATTPRLATYKKMTTIVRLDSQVVRLAEFIDETRFGRIALRSLAGHDTHRPADEIDFR